MNTLDDLKNELIQGQKFSMQGSYQRRAPEKKAVPYLLNARFGLKEYVKQYPRNVVAWRLLSQAEEYLLNYSAAIECVQKVIELGNKDRKDLKRLVMLRECFGQWQELSLTQVQLEGFECYLEEKTKVDGCDHTLKSTKEWLDQNVPKSKKAKIVKSLQNQGGYCDCEVLMNTIN